MLDWLRVYFAIILHGAGAGCTAEKWAAFHSWYIDVTRSFRIYGHVQQIRMCCVCSCISRIGGSFSGEFFVLIFFRFFAFMKREDDDGAFTIIMNKSMYRYADMRVYRIYMWVGLGVCVSMRLCV